MREAAEDCGEKDWDGNPFTFEDMVQAGHDYLKTGDRFTQLGSTKAQRVMRQKAEKYWQCWSIVTSVKLADDIDYGQPFRCSC